MIRIADWTRDALASVYWFTTLGRWRLKDVFNELYEGQTRSPTFRSIFRDAFGDQYAEEVDPCGYVTISDLGQIVKYLAVRKDQQIVDLACGRGGTGLWIARATEARLVGVDLSDVAVEKATQRITDFGLDGKAEFRVADFANTGLATADFDGAISIDSLFLVPDKAGALRETARILKPGAHFAVTTWEMDLATGVRDYRPVFQEAGFEIEAYDLTPEWEQRQRRVLERFLEEQSTLYKEMGKSAAKVWFRYVNSELPKLPHMRRVFIAARKK
jgi:SAM-dependent methyltransferase